MRFFLFSLAALMICVSAVPAQRRRADADTPTMVVARFEGVLKLVDKKKIVLELGEDKTLTMLVNKKTEFRAGEKPVKPAEVAEGTPATVEAYKNMGELVALVVRLR